MYAYPGNGGLGVVRRRRTNVASEGRQDVTQGFTIFHPAPLDTILGDGRRSPVNRRVS